MRENQKYSILHCIKKRKYINLYIARARDLLSRISMNGRRADDIPSPRQSILRTLLASEDAAVRNPLNG